MLRVTTEFKMATVKKHFVVGSTEDFCDRSHFIMSQ